MLWAHVYTLEYSFLGGSIFQEPAVPPNNCLTPTHVAVLTITVLSLTRQCCVKQQPLHIFLFSMSVGLQKETVSLSLMISHILAAAFLKIFILLRSLFNPVLHPFQTYISYFLCCFYPYFFYHP